MDSYNELNLFAIIFIHKMQHNLEFWLRMCSNDKRFFMYGGIYMHRKVFCFLLVAGATIAPWIGFSLSVASFRCRVEWSYASCGVLRYTITKNSFEFIIFIEIQSDCVKLCIFMAEQKIFICFSVKLCVFK